MKAFASLVKELGSSSGTNEKLQAVSAYFSTAASKDKVWVIALFTGRRPKRTVTTTQLKHWCVEITDIKEWLFEECYHTVGDLAETIGLLIPAPELDKESLPLYHYVEALIDLQSKDEADKKSFITNA